MFVTLQEKEQVSQPHRYARITAQEPILYIKCSILQTFRRDHCATPPPFPPLSRLFVECEDGHATGLKQGQRHVLDIWFGGPGKVQGARVLGTSGLPTEH